MDHRRVNPEPARQLGYRLLTLQGFQSHTGLELRFVNLAFRHRQSPSSKISRHQNYSLSNCPVSGEDLRPQRLRLTLIHTEVSEVAMKRVVG